MPLPSSCLCNSDVPYRLDSQMTVAGGRARSAMQVATVVRFPPSNSGDDPADMYTFGSTERHRERETKEV